MEKRRRKRRKQKGKVEERIEEGKREKETEDGEEEDFINLELKDIRIFIRTLNSLLQITNVIFTKK